MMIQLKERYMYHVPCQVTHLLNALPVLITLLLNLMHSIRMMIQLYYVKYTYIYKVQCQVTHL